MLHIQSKYWKSLKEIRKQTKNSVDGVSISRLKQGEYMDSKTGEGISLRFQGLSRT